MFPSPKSVDPELPWRDMVTRGGYCELYRRNQPARDAEEMARLAERVGHPFEAIIS
jgi:hypothetical protein